MWAVVLAAIFVTWYWSEGTLSIHSITNQRREAFYWATVLATFALGTALGDFTATSLNLGYLGSGIVFSLIILVPALAWWRLGLNAIVAFWCAYVVTRPLGASFADYISKPPDLSGIGFGDGPTALVFTAAVVVLVGYLALARPDIQPSLVLDLRARPLCRSESKVATDRSERTGHEDLQVRRLLIEHRGPCDRVLAWTRRGSRVGFRFDDCSRRRGSYGVIYSVC